MQTHIREKEETSANMTTVENDDSVAVTFGEQLGIKDVSHQAYSTAAGPALILLLTFISISSVLDLQALDFRGGRRRRASSFASTYWFGRNLVPSGPSLCAPPPAAGAARDALLWAPHREC
jgi:hypothetical protein